MIISYAFRNPKRDENSIVYATDCTDEDIGKRFYCPNPNCNAHMYLCNLGAHNNIKPYFRATRKSHPHIEGCIYAKLNIHSILDYNEPEFDFEKATLNVMKPSRSGKSSTEKQSVKESKKLPPHTIKQIYELAVSNDINFTFNGYKMWELLADKRSARFYQTGIFSSRLVECLFAGYNKNKKFIRMKYFYNNENFHYLKLLFNNDEVFSKALSFILQERKSPIVIWGYWHKIDYFYFKTSIFSLSQIYVPK